ncbi:MAG: hypothetical protein ABW156_03010 [Jiangellaceae bacterium]
MRLRAAAVAAVTAFAAATFITIDPFAPEAATETDGFAGSVLVIEGETPDCPWDLQP